jgi:ABC transporter DrrB family efflux protein
LQPVLILVLFVSVLENLASVSGGSYRQFLIPGIMIENVVLTAPVTGLALVRDADTGLADRFRSLPMSRSAVLVGRLLSDAVVFFVQALVMIGVAYLLGFRVHTGLTGVAGIIAVAVAFGIALGVTCAWLSLLIRDVETAERALFFPFIPLAFVSSAYAPVGSLAGWLQPLARVNPVSAAVAVVRALADGGPTAGRWRPRRCSWRPGPRRSRSCQACSPSAAGSRLRDRIRAARCRGGPQGRRGRCWRACSRRFGLARSARPPRPGR